MKKFNYLAIVLMALVLTGCPENPNNPEEPNLPSPCFVAKPFSVSASKQIVFSSGNLQYTQSTDKWSFASTQYEVLGTNNVTGGSVSFDPEQGYDNHYGNTVADKIDLFCWSTSISNFGIIDPPIVDWEKYYLGSFVDWGTNKIGNDAPNTWRTLTYDEWDYVVFKRPNASSLCGVAQVNNVNGLILLPDDWSYPVGITFKPDFHRYDGVDYYAGHQTFTAGQWLQLEQLGAVFLPAAGHRGPSSVSLVQSDGFYWSITEGHDTLGAYSLRFHSSRALMYYVPRDFGNSVRLVQDVK